jgi:Protein of unknown function (DUF3833)
MAEQQKTVPLALRLEQFLLGASSAVGMFEDRFGAVRRRMAITLDGRMDGATLVLDEHFTFDDGERERRVWRITPQGDAGYVATADDMIGVARGQATANGVAWSYRFSLRIGARRLKVRFHETFTLVSPDVMINRARVTKFGIQIGATTIVFKIAPN